ncbi:relaxase/mobilization nuclease domain-containing protein [Mucilaginibacter robiniae]|uniref:Relaxase/mobilization nuclease domain-containing protein n=1 Tax=Mucilaginibacter robiniae TaxID=2728022 RepID=A0A7L5DY79_9SPHI|nr:relaxase/mobilization nuclease domain-containing protein [Mucilaginibacter robiniae]QJD95721.1 relaxase/mobilization nuclease domain-containing protein [Mucilaginibacter robiniae]
MVGKTITGKSFSGCLRYVLGKSGAHLLDASEDLRTDSISALTQDFNFQRSLNPNLGKAVGHLVLSWHRQDAPKLSGEVMAARAREYMELMGVRDTQYIIVQHTDRSHPHLHIVYNRIDNQGRTISDRNNYRRNEKACKMLTAKYGYTFGEGKEQVSRERLRGSEKARYELFDTIKAAAREAINWQQLEALLNVQGVSLEYKYKGQSTEVQGISFSKGELKFKGSAIDRSLSYGNLDRQLQQNWQLAERTAMEEEELPAQANDTLQPKAAHQRSQQATNCDEAKAGNWLDWMQGFGGAGDVDDEQVHKRRRNRGR